MNIRILRVHDIEVEVVRKRVRNVNLTVYPPDGRVRVSAPHHCSDDTIRTVLIARLSWIRKKQELLRARPLQSSPRTVTGDTHMVFGEKYRLAVIESSCRPQVVATAENVLLLQVRPGSSGEKRAVILNQWYREQLQSRIPSLMEKWQPVIGVEVSEWRIKKMKTRWGTCNIEKKRIWLNLELAKMSVACLEYVLVHELVHLLERYHNARFHGFMDRFLPHWRTIRAQMKGHPPE